MSRLNKIASSGLFALCVLVGPLGDVARSNFDEVGYSLPLAALFLTAGAAMTYGIFVCCEKAQRAPGLDIAYRASIWIAICVLLFRILRELIGDSQDARHLLLPLEQVAILTA